MTVGKTHSGKTTFAKEVNSILKEAIKKLQPIEGPNTLKFSLTNLHSRIKLTSSILRRDLVGAGAVDNP
jgi:energy-coupling factor transporter ATP-binding protein EcfA2